MAGVRKVLRAIARDMGVSTSYHVAARYHTTGMHQADMSMTCRIIPWLHSDNYKDLVAYIASQATNSTETPCITSITKLGL